MKALFINKNNVSIIDDELEIKKIESDYKNQILSLNISDEVINRIKSKEVKNVNDENLLNLREKVDSYRNERLYKLEQYLPFVSDKFPKIDEELDFISSYFILENGVVYEKYKVEKNHFVKVKSKIDVLKSQLSDTDYIIIKVYEAKLSMSDSPYSQEQLEKIIQERQALRDKINELEELLK